MQTTEQVIDQAMLAVQNFSKRLNIAGLVLLCLAVYLPGILRLPAVDRTETIYAETTRAMLERGTWLDPRYGDTVHPFRPIGTFWAQGVAATLAGPSHARDIQVYRLPGFLAVTLSVLALAWLAAPLLGSTVALVAAALFAVAPLTALLSNLAIAETLSLLPATLAMLSLLRIYCARKDANTRRLAFVFWGALGFGILINAFLVPIIVISALLALRVMDRDMWWLERLRPVVGVPLALAIAAPWLAVRILQDGIPFSGMGFKAFLGALGGAQDMKVRAWPGTFLLAATLGFLPGTALLPAAVFRLWNSRNEKLARFLLAWIIGYLVYLEVMSSKPGTYMVQTLFPALALSVAMLVMSDDGKLPLAKFNLIPWPPLAAVFAAGLIAAPYAILHEGPPVWGVAVFGAVAMLFYLSAHEGRAGHLVRWAQYGVAGLALLAVTLFAGILPSIDKIWPMRQTQTALAACPAAPTGMLGFTEPTSRFVLNRDAVLSTAAGLGKLADGTSSGYAGITDAWNEQNPHALSRAQMSNVRPIACLRSIDPMRACQMTLTILAPILAPPCPIPPQYACNETFLMQSAGPRHIRPCD